MTQRDEIFGQLQQATTGRRAAYTCTASRLNGHFNLTKQNEMMEAIAYAFSQANPFADQLIRVPGLMGTGLYLNRVASSIERFDDNFVLRSTYRINWSLARNWSRNNEPLYAAATSLQQLASELAREANHNRNDFQLNSKQRVELERIVDTVRNRPRSEAPMDHWLVTCTIVGELTDDLRLESRRDSYHYTFNYSYDLSYSVLNGFRLGTHSVDMRLGLAQQSLTKSGQFIDVHLQFHNCELEDIVNAEESLNLVKNFRRHEPERVYLDWLPKPETVSLAIAKEGRMSLFKRTDLEPDSRPVKELNDMVIGDKLNVPIKIEMFCTLESTSHSLEPGVYQFLYKEGAYFDGDMFSYGESMQSELSTYRVTFPTGKVVAITPSSDQQVVTRANISRRELSLPQDGVTSHTHQINKNF